MKPIILKSIIAGLAATLAMSMVMFAAPYMGLSKMSAPQMLSGMLHVSIVLGWVMHFMIGVIFSISYGLFFRGWVHKVNSNAMRGLIFGFAVFLFAQVMMMIMDKMMPEPKMEESMLLMMIGSLTGHLIYGLVVGLIVTEKKPSLSFA